MHQVENILFPTRDRACAPKISDFGLSRRFGDANQMGMYTGCGTVGYVAPEVLNRTEYNCKVDIFALGVIAYVVLSGTEPFTGDNDMETAQRTKDNDYDFEGDEWAAVSQEAKAFITACLLPDPAQRPSARAALALPWLQAAQAAQAP